MKLGESIRKKKSEKKCGRTCIKATPIITYHLSKTDAKNILSFIYYYLLFITIFI